MSVEWGSVAEWVSGIGALAASGVALYLATPPKVKLKTYCGQRTIVTTNLSPIHGVSFVVTNVGIRTATITHVGLQFGKRKKKQSLIINFIRDGVSDGLPRVLHDGEYTSFFVNLSDDPNWYAELVKDAKLNESDLSTLRYYVLTSTGEEFTGEPEEPVIEALRAAIEQRSS